MKFPGHPVKVVHLDLTKRAKREQAAAQSGAEATDENNGATSFKMENTPGETGDHFSVCQVITKGSEENPAWVFQAENQPVLQGLIQNAQLGTLNVIARSCRVAATFGSLTARRASD